MTTESRAARNERIHAVRRRILELSHRANSTHLGSALSCVEILNSIFFAAGVTPSTMEVPDRSRIVLSKGHAAMSLYATLEDQGLIAPNLLESYLQDGSALWGHVTRMPGAQAIDVSTGSLGHGLSLSTGFALGYRLRGWRSRIYCVLGDGECEEGSVWEAALFAGHHRLENVTAIVDYNKIQGLGRVSSVLDIEPLADKWTSFGWTVHEVDGHDPWALDATINVPSDRPTVVLAHTIKGKGVPRMEDTVASHYTPAQRADLTEYENNHA